MIISKQCLGRNATSIRHSDEFIVKEAANILSTLVSKLVQNTNIYLETSYLTKYGLQPLQVCNLVNLQTLWKCFMVTFKKEDDDHRSIGITYPIVYPMIKSPIQRRLKQNFFNNIRQVTHIETAKAELIQHYKSSHPYRDG